jgi:hypothetical protein
VRGFLYATIGNRLIRFLFGGTSAKVVGSIGVGSEGLRTSGAGWINC